MAFPKKKFNKNLVKAKALASVSKSIQKNELKHITLSEESKDLLNLLENTSENLFITGRAGTGKSTLLNYFRDTTKKNVGVVAPTGVAALNVRGQTIHGFFKFKIGVTENDIKKLDPESITGRMYQKVDVLIIDEISMVRADMFDCIEKFMRLNGKDHAQPFGGAQVVVIGDLFQLPPVVGYGEQHIFETKYESPYFFDSKAYKQGMFGIFELTHVYRQNDPVFIDILDKIRTGEADLNHVEYINKQCYVQDSTYTKKKIGRTLGRDDVIYVSDEGVPFEEEVTEVIEKKKESPVSIIDDLKKQFGLTTVGSSTVVEDSAGVSVYLVTTNSLAETINTKKLSELKGESRTYKGSLTGRFDQKNIPAPHELTLKVGAQVMTLKNDPGGRWVNGDIGVVEKMLHDSVKIKFEDGREETVVGDSWEMVKYDYDPVFDSLGSEVVGTYSQLPIKLAWAVTIHKSQGKTFDKATIDFGSGTFAHGQAYVALSRVRSLEGITLKTPLTAKDVRIDERVREFLLGSR